MAAKKSPRKSFVKKDRGPSRTDIQSDEIENDILEFWKAIGNSALKEWDRPWVYQFMLAENAGKFLTTGERYVYKGGFNQFLIAHSAGNKTTDRATLVMNRTDMAKIFGVEDFGDSPVVQNRIKSLGSIFNRPVEKIVATSYHYPSGARWQGETPEAKPTQAQIDSLNLEKKHVKKLVFNTFPIWSAEDIYDLLPEEHKAKIDELVSLRRMKGFDFNPEDDIQAHIDKVMDDILQRQGIKVHVGGDSAHYTPALDEMTTPDKSLFVNPVAWFAVQNHELAHSTKHLNGRLAKSGGRSTIEYAIEEVVAETTAVMMVKNLEKSLQDALPSRPDIRQMFDDYYANAMTYNHGWGEKFDFAGGVAAIESAKGDDKSIVKTILVNVAKAVDALQNGVFTPEQRLEAKNENFKRLSNMKRDAQLEMS